jgi:hypothetical protein
MAGYNSMVQHWNGSAWTDRTTGGASRDWLDLWVASASEAYVVGERISSGHVQRWNGAQWESVVLGPDVFAVSDRLRAVVGQPGGNVWAFGVDGTIAVQRPADSFRKVTEAVTGSVRDLWAGDSDQLWITNGDGIVAHYNGSKWLLLPNPKSGASSSANGGGIWASGPNDLIVAMPSGSGVVARWDGAQWTNIAGSQPFGTTDLWASGPNDVWLGKDRLNRWDGSEWTTVSTNPIVMIDGTGPNDVWALEGRGIQHWDGSTQTQLTTPEMTENGGLWLNGGSLYVAGDHGGSLSSECDFGGYVLVYDAGSWTTLRDASTGCGFTAIAGRSRSDYWVAKENAPVSTGLVGSVVHYSGTTGVDEVLPGAPTIRGLVATSDGTIWASGGNGVFYRRP